MPIERELTNEELMNLSAQGIDTDQYRGKKLTLATDEEVAAMRPAQQEVTKPLTSLQAGEATLKRNAGGIVGGGAASIGAGAFLAPWLAGPEVGIPANIAALVAIAGTGMAGGYAGQKVQDKILGEETTASLQKQYEQAQTEHPYVSEGTDIVASALASGGKPNLSNIPKAITGNKEAITKIAMNALVNPAINTGLNLATTGELPSASDLGKQALGGSLFSESWLPHAGKGALESKGEPTAEPTAKSEVKEQEGTKSPFNSQHENGTPMVGDLGVQQLFSENINKKPSYTKMSTEEGLTARQKYQQLSRIPVEEQRQMLHDQWVDEQAKKPEPVAEPLQKTEATIATPKVEDVLPAKKVMTEDPYEMEQQKDDPEQLRLATELEEEKTGNKFAPLKKPSQLFGTTTEKELQQERPFGVTLDKEGNMHKSTLLQGILSRAGKGELEMLNENGLQDYLATKGSKVNASEVAQWVKENGPKVEVKKFGEESQDPIHREYRELTHGFFDDLSLSDKNLFYYFNNSIATEADLKGKQWSDIKIEKAKRYKEVLTDQRIITGDQGKSAHWSMVAPKAEKDMPGYVEIAVVKPHPLKTKTNPDGSLTRSNAAQFPSQHSFPPNTLAFARGYMEHLPSGEKVFHVVEVQSDWAAREQRREQEIKNKDNPDSFKKSISDAAKQQGDPRLAHYETLALKAAIEHARQEGATKVAVSDAETAMMSEGHDRNQISNRYNIIPKDNGFRIEGDPSHRVYKTYQEAGVEFEKLRAEEQKYPSQEPGMRAAYDNRLPNIMKKITGKQGVGVEFGEHEKAFTDISEHGTINGREHKPRPDLIFRNPDGTPKTSVTAKMFDISDVASKREKGESFTQFGNRYSPLSDYQSALQSVKQHIQQGTINTAEGREAWSSLERIKNKNNGQVPKEEPVATHQLISHIRDEEATAGSVLSHISRMKSEFAPLAKHMLQTLHLDKLQDRVTAANTGRSYYNLFGKIVRLDRTEIGNVKEIMHELGHVAISKNIPEQFDGLRGADLKKSMDLYLHSGDANPHMKELIQSYYEAAKNLGLHDSLFNDKGLGGQKIRGVAGAADEAYEKHGHIGYGMGNLDEFSSYVTSDKDFQKKLNEMPSGLKDGKSLWSRIVEAVRGLLGVPVKEGSLLERALKATDSLSREERPVESIPKIKLPPHLIEEHKEHKVGAPPKGKDEELKTNRLGFLGKSFTAAIDKIHELAHPEAHDLAKGFTRMFQEKEHILGAQMNPVLEAAKKLTPEQDKRVADAGRWMRENRSLPPVGMLKTPVEIRAFNVARQALKDNVEYRIKSGEPIIGVDGKKRSASYDPFYWPTTTNPKTANVYRANTDTKEIAKQDKQFIDYQTKTLGKALPEAATNLEEYKRALQGNAMNNGGSNNAFFNASRRAEGIPLPPEHTRLGFGKNFEAYFNAQATDNAYYKHIESQPKLAALLGYTKDAWSRPVEASENGALIGNDAVRHVLDQVKGESISGQQGQVIKKSESLATAALLGPLTELHKLVSNVFTQISGYADNPVQSARILAHGITGMAEGWTHAKENGKITMTARSASDMWNSQLTAADRLGGVAKAIRNIYTLGELSDKVNLGFLQASGEYLMPLKVQQANAGDRTAQRLMQHLDPDWYKGREYTPKEITQLSSALAGVVHGTRDARTLPSWMLHDNEVSAFFKLSSWGISQTNRFMRDVYTPATEGNVKPLLMSAFGAAVGGYLIKELREQLAGKKSQIPSLSEIASSERGLSGNIPAVAYNMMAAASYAGFGGMLSTVGRYPFDWAFKNTPQGATFPLDTVVGDLAQTISQTAEAVANDPNINWLELSSHVGAHLMGSSFQLGRVAMNHAINEGVVTGSLAEKKELNDKMGDLRRFYMVNGLPYSDVDAGSNPYLNLEQKKFKSTQDVGEAMKMLPSLVSNIIQKYGNNPDVMRSKLEALKQNSYSTLPSPETMPLEFTRYVQYLGRLKGQDAAQKAVQDYFRHRVVNSVKGGIVP